MTTDEMAGALDGAVEWVTKTNVTDHARCPRAWWLIAHGEITHEESISPYDLPEVEAGVAFERDIVAGARPVDLDELTAEAQLSAAGHPALVFETGLWMNHNLGLRGEPDGIEIASRAWAPSRSSTTLGRHRWTDWSWRSTGCCSNRSVGTCRRALTVI